MIDYIWNSFYSIIPHDMDMWLWYVGVWFITLCMIISIIVIYKFIKYFNDTEIK
jgi:hypothetical protein